MLFNSFEFLFVFLPVTVAGFFVFGRMGAGLAATWLAVASVVFYSWWDWRFTLILAASILFNFMMGSAIAARVVAGQDRAARLFLIAGIGADLVGLGYFKYMNFFVQVFVDVSGHDLAWSAIALPIGISFFTFTQIAYLVDTAQNKVGRVDPVRYVLFVTYFPHLIAGPILHHAEMMPQFRRQGCARPSAEAIGVGLTVLVMGLVKKLVIADPLAVIADNGFRPALVPGLGMIDAWAAVLAYTLQIYFDFSAYCDMAEGISRMFGITLPANFESPYKALSITDFWRRWHMSLSRFLRDYLYIPLGGNRRGPSRRIVNLMTTMLLGGLWHGAGWTFLIWGGLHGAYLVVNHAWAAMEPGDRRPTLPSWLAWGLTFMAVMVAWVFFRAPDIGTALAMLRAMAAGGLPDIGTVRGFAVWAVPRAEAFAMLGVSMGIALFMPNVRQIMSGHELVLPSAVFRPADAVMSRLKWVPNGVWAVTTLAMLALCVTRLNRVSQFLYFQF